MTLRSKYASHNRQSKRGDASKHQQGVNAFFQPLAKMRASHSVVQPKLTIGGADDAYEREADAVADQVVQRSPNSPSTATGGPSVAPQAIQSQLTNGYRGGSPLPNAIQTEMGTTFDADFSNVRVHTDQRSAQLNTSLQAQAFTYGSDIYFNSGTYKPHTREGQHLLAHELTHVVQQSGMTGPTGIQRQEAEETEPAINERDEWETPTLTLSPSLLRLTGGYLFGEYRLSGESSLSNPVNVLGFPGLSPSTFSAALTFGSDCNRAFQEAFIQFQHLQQSGRDVFDFNNNRNQFTAGISFRSGSTLLSPGLTLDFNGNQFDSILFTLTIIGGVSTQTPSYCLPTTVPPTIQPPPPEPERPLRLPSYTLHFYYDSSLIVPDSNDDLQRLISTLLTLRSTRVLLVGHTSLEGTAAYNQDLSERRANAIQQWLELAGVEASRITTLGMGETAPESLEPDMGATFGRGPIEQARTRNRRVEAILIDSSGQFLTDFSLQMPDFGSIPNGLSGFLFRYGVAQPE